MEGQLIQTVFEKTDWMTIFVVVACFLVWSVWRNAGGFLEQKTSDLFHSHQRKSLFSVDTMSELRISIVFSVVYLFVFSLFLMHQYVLLGGESSALGFVMLMLGLVAYHSVKLIIVRFVSSVYDVSAQAKQWMDSYLVLNHFLGLIFIPIVIGITYGGERISSILTGSSIFLIFLYFVFLLIRFFNIFFSNISSIVYVFLYFCILEILPLAILVKLAW